MTAAIAECPAPLTVKPSARPRRSRQPSKSPRREKPGPIVQKRQPEFEIPRPATQEELQLADALAIARDHLESATTAWNERRRWQQTNAAELYDRSKLQQFQADAKAWRADPFGMRLVFGSTWHSAAFLSDLWRSVLEAIDSNIGLTYDQIKHVILATGGDWRVDRLDALHGRPMCWFLALHPDAASFLKHWVCDSRARRPGRAAIDIELDRQRARAFLEAAPAAGPARENLRRLAGKEAETWNARAEALRQAHFQERARCAEVNPPQALGDSSEVRETRRLRRELTAAEDRFERIERRMLAVLNTRRPKAPVATTAVVTNRLETARPETVNPPAAGPAEPAQTPAGTPHPETPQAIEIESVASLLRNGSAGVAGAENDSAHSNRPARRPDPKLLAKAWRVKQKRKGRGKTE